MMTLDIVNTARQAYRIAWTERQYLMKLALVPLIIKYIFYVIAVNLVESNDILRLSLFMVPAYFVEGWLLSHWVRTLIVPHHRWPFQPSGNDARDLKEMRTRARGIMAGSVAYALINLLIAGFFSFFMGQIPMDMDPAEANPAVAISGIVMMVLTFFLFRFVWLYIPLAVNVNLQVVLRKLRAKGVSFNLIGVWLACFMPPILALYMTGGILSTIGGADPFPLMDGLIMLVRVALDTVKNILVTAGMAYAMFKFWI